MVLEVLVYDLGGCEGCPLSVLRGLQQIERVARLYINYLGNLDLDREYDVAVVTGAVCMNDDEKIEVLRKIRSKAGILIAYGSCASVGGITLFCRGGQSPRPEHRFWQPISRVVEVDYSIPGCPPAPASLFSLLNCISTGKGGLLGVFKALAKTHRLSGFDLIDEVVLTGLCVGCGVCTLSCPTHALEIIDGKPNLIVERCIRCGTCCSRCPRFTSLLVKRVGR